MANHTGLQKTFDRLSINTDRPGFYDEPGFLLAEKRDRRFLKKYAEYIDSLSFESEYLASARRIAIQVADYLFDELTKEGRLGACIDISGTAMRMLDQENVWSYMVCGSTIVEFPAQSGLGTKYFKPIMHPGKDAKTGHAWLSVPPFKVLDISLALQPYPSSAVRYLNRYIAEEVVVAAPETTISDLMDFDCVTYFRHLAGRNPSMSDLPKIAPGVKEFMAEFPPFQLVVADCRLRYVPTKMSATDVPLSKMRNLCLRGKYPADLYCEFRERVGAE